MGGGVGDGTSTIPQKTKSPSPQKSTGKFNFKNICMLFYRVGRGKVEKDLEISVVHAT